MGDDNKMEDEKEYETVYYVSAPFANSEEEISTSYVINDNEFVTEEIVFVDENGQIVQNEDGIVILHEEISELHAQIEENGAENETTDQVETEASLEHQENETVIHEENSVMEYEENAQDPENAVVEPEATATESGETSVMEQENSVPENEEGSTTENHEGSIVENDNADEIDDIRVINEQSADAIHDDPSTSEDPQVGHHVLLAQNKGMILNDTLKLKKAIIPEGTKLNSRTCEYCLREFKHISNKSRHVKQVHKLPKEIRTYIKCIECNTNFTNVQGLRKHLELAHNLQFPMMSFKFPNMNAFRKWKHEVERKDLSSFTMRHGSKRTAGGMKYFYICHRSGIYSSKLGTGARKRMLKTAGTCKLGIVCTAAIYAEETGNEITVRYYPQHYGHGKETSFVQLSTEEQTAIQENISNGMSFESLVDDIRDSQSADHFQLFLLKKRDIKFINNAFNSEDYNLALEDIDSVDHWVRLCCQMEDSPILFYRQEEGFDDEFLLIIMTEFQKQILLASERQVVCVDSLHRRKGARFYLTCIFIIDEYDNAFPVAFCISHKVDRNVMTQFFSAIKESTGALSCTYFMSDSEKFYYEAWVDVMEDNPYWFWSLWYVDYRIKVQLRVFKGNTAKRADAYKTMRMLLECQNTAVFETMFKNYLETLFADPQSKGLGNFIMQKYGSCKETWASCYRKDIKIGTIIHLEALHRTLRYCCREGRKKRMDKFIIVIMKLVRYKMLDRLNSDLDEDKVNLAVEAINMCHSIGLEIPTEHISSLSDKIWLINSEDDEQNVYVTQDFTTCPEHCSLKCSECDICVHMYSCSCVHSMINANLCQHIHAVVWKFMTPHFSPPGSPGGGAMDDDEIENVDTSVAPDNNPEKLLDNVLARTHDIFKKVRANRGSLKRDSLTAIMTRLNECYDIASGKAIPDPPSVFKNPVIVVNPYVKPPGSQGLTVQSPNVRAPQFQIPQMAGLPRISLPGTSQPGFPPGLPQPSRFILPNQIQNMLSQNKQGSQYVLLLPNSSFIQK